MGIIPERKRKLHHSGFSIQHVAIWGFGFDQCAADNEHAECCSEQGFRQLISTMILTLR